MVVQEHFDAPLASLVDSSTENDPNKHGNLRRELQTSPVCRATQPVGNALVCGGFAGGNDDPCKNSAATCNGLTYGCSCSGSVETTCSYCQVRTANAILCQPSGASTTFRDLDGKMMTCSCEYIGNGQVQQNCHEPSLMPIPFPTSQPVDVRAPTAPIPSAMPPQSSPIDTQVTCRATNPFNVNLGAGSTCGVLANYPCTCSGSSDTSCSYCQVQTLNAVICQVSGSDITFLDPTNGGLKTCHCEYRGNGQGQQYCYQEGGVVYSDPAPVGTPTSQRAPTASSPVSLPIAEPILVAKVAPPPKKPKKTKRV